MKINLAVWDRVLRFIFGVIFTSWAFAGGPLWGYGGIYLLFTCGWGICPIYSFFKMSTIKIAERPLVPPEN